MGSRPKPRPATTVTDAVNVVEASTPRAWSDAQEDIFKWFAKPSNPYFYTPEQLACWSGNLIVRARAGTGKTTTIVEGVNRAPEDFILVAAFNVQIAAELKARITNPSVEVKTLHSLGYAMVRREWPKIDVCKGFERADALTNGALLQTEHERGEKTPRVIRNLVTKLHTKAREITPLDYSPDILTNMAFRFDLVPDDTWRSYDLEFVVAHACAALDEAATVEPSYATGIDYADMIALPLMWELTARDYQLGVVDEAQDMTVAQLELFRRSVEGRICVVGDDRQAIYGFRGADCQSLDRLKAELGAIELPLTTTYRCGRRIVEAAQRLVSDIEAGPTNPEGEVEVVSYGRLMEEVKAGDFVLSRTNAPLIAITLRLLRNGKRARMRGRNIGEDIQKVLTKIRADRNEPLDDVIRRIRSWGEKRIGKLAAAGQHDLIAAMRDKVDTLLGICADCETVREVEAKLDYLFTDDSENGTIICSTIHKAKGLEADHVWVLKDTLYTRGRTREEENIDYVATTRAKSHLTFVTVVAPPKPADGGLSPLLTSDDAPF